MITAQQGMTRELWLKRCAARFMQRVKDFTQEEADNYAEACLENVNGDLQEHPEDCADEEMSVWSE